MMIAAQNKNREIIDLLADAHADLNIQEKVWEYFFHYLLELFAYGTKQ